jgi:hypothetical protein
MVKSISSKPFASRSTYRRVWRRSVLDFSAEYDTRFLVYISGLARMNQTTNILLLMRSLLFDWKGAAVPGISIPKNRIWLEGQQRVTISRLSRSAELGAVAETLTS